MGAVKATMLLLIFALLLCVTVTGAVKSEAPQFDSIYQFGDGFSDTGNLVIESPSYATRCAYTPYGMSISDEQLRFPFGHGFPASGRCSDGLLIIDYFARSLNLATPLPYMRIESPTADLEHGINFAMDGGGTALALKQPYDFLKQTLSYQLSWFQHFLNSTCTRNNLHGEDCKNKLSNALFVMGEIGANDYKESKLGMQDILDSLIPQVVSSIIQAAEFVMDRGAVHLIVPGVYPLGCTPDAIHHRDNVAAQETSRDSFGCVEQLNDISRVHNEQLKQGLKELQKERPNVQIHYGDYYNAFTWLLQNAASLGFEGEDVVTEQCCDFPCGFDDTKVCKDPSKMISWDGTHLTQQAYSHMAHWLLQDIFSTATSPTTTSSASPAASPMTSSSSASSPSRSSHSGAAGISCTIFQWC